MRVIKISQAPKIKAITLVLLICAIMSILCSYRGSAMPERACDSRDAASLVAESFLKTDETYKFDGMKDTLSIRVEHASSLEDIIAPKFAGAVMAPVTLQAGPREYTFKAKFDSRHSGYGDRAGKYLAEVITPHEAEITVVNCQVASAIMDGKWDMVGEKMVP